ncbi:YicC/YloC family endoribonuclease [Eubacterium barkeri]|uniref:TIGR00255 family protein n=1 Tax=Eubacterium barkeri TaxID=1528 RepID=A0A1H3EIU0_EUBBA|nr:YicC/YloC family endoribonuclease [Eubacterium barkeri]SDX78666.1 TIGR00255 family protein [Eubacterium barkeri]
MKSMTGFGRQDYRDESVEISVEIKTVNHRYRDFFLKIPRMLGGNEANIRETISETIARGRIEVFIKYKELDAQNKRIVFNRELAMGYIQVLNAIKNLDSMISDEIDLALVAKFPDVIELEETPGDDHEKWLGLKPVLQGALSQVDASRLREGAAMKTDIQGRCVTINQRIEAIQEKAPQMLAAYAENLHQRVADYTQSVEPDEQRLLSEVAIMADRLAIDEELTRLHTHMERLSVILEETQEPIGRKLDFLIQEINREINTIGSKVNDVDIAGMVVDIKSEIEKIREQVQNIE